MGPAARDVSDEEELEEDNEDKQSPVGIEVDFGYFEVVGLFRRSLFEGKQHGISLGLGRERERLVKEISERQVWGHCVAEHFLGLGMGKCRNEYRSLGGF